ncbi:Xaa-Pro peptidase family protein [Bradyrhizobium sp. CCGB12]|uniref:M24 family metallopeptidase n=1 Tax=Bradyrhizobium sp. CCGB12 TaxID=2949632 RepID=UPI0020B334E8|nr:Xaa-Pro peptidase family protein [Bradyrhizobium sp. CCGB12]MCP3392276.1 Xaa-Pro peptidase family protein [Bradyrhizobium sp. CCGB12]
MAITKGPQSFPKSEYLRRLAAVKSEMARLDIETLFVVDVANLTYLTGHWGAPTTIPQGLIVSLREEEPAFIVRKMDVPAAHHQTFLQRGSVIGYPENLVANPDKDGYDAVIDSINELGVSNRCLGIEQSALPTPTIEKFKARLPNAKILDCSNLVAWVRIVKSDLEISIMKEAAAITDAAIARAVEVIRPGMREADAAAEIVGTLIRGANGKAGTGLQHFYLCASPRTSTAHVWWTDDVFRQGSQINLELGGKRLGYCAAIMRTFSIGQPSDRLRRMHEAEVAGLEAALATVRPGATCSDVANAFYRTMEKHGLAKESRCGYSLGINWLEKTASLRDGDMTELKPNMTFHLMLGNWVDEDFGYVIGESFRVTETGSEVLTSTPRKLFEL